MTLSGHVIKFLICSSSGGRAAGVYEATDEEEIKVLADAVASKRGVSEIDEAQFETLKKKATQTPQSGNSGGSRPRVVRIPTLPDLAVEASPGVPSAGRLADGTQRAPLELPPSPAPSIASLLQVRKVNPPRPFSGSDVKTDKASKRGDRAKIRVARASVGV